VTLLPTVDRRDVLKLGGAAAIAILTPVGIGRAPPAGSAASTIVIADPRYHDSLIFGESLRQHGAKDLTLASDRAALWSQTIKPRLRSGLKYLAGLTLESDLFVLERLAEGSGMRISYVGFHDWRRPQDSAHTLSGSITLDLIAAALIKGNEHWARNLGQALILIKESHQAEERLNLKCAMKVGCGPRFFVSWLMRWA